ALGVDTGTPDAVRAALTAREDALRTRLLPPTAVGRGTTTPPALAALPEGTRLPITTEAAATRTHADGLPPGVHQVTATAPDGRTARSHLIAAPPRLPAPPGRTHGLLVQLYSLLSHRSWGMGDLGDLRALADWAGRTLDAGFIQVNPLHAAVPGAPTDPSPYRPSSRRFPDPVHLRVEDIPEYAHVEDHDRLPPLLDRAAQLREAAPPPAASPTPSPCASRTSPNTPTSRTTTGSAPSSTGPHSCARPSSTRTRSSTATPSGTPNAKPSNSSAASPSAPAAAPPTATS